MAEVLLASGNQLRNLDKQLTLLSRFAFLKKLDLFENPVGYSFKEATEVERGSRPSDERLSKRFGLEIAIE